ncbi:hypothetical protein ACQK5W_05515 [Pantoea sp. FN060301]|uniref:hypothetical protein n=1 Tax=Pantoea sp. FN060301 TaxID=3420380 RepID=UPI003D178178
MSEEARIRKLEETVQRLSTETRALKEILSQQIALNNITYKGKFDDVLEKLAKEFADKGLDEVENRDVHDAIREYIKYQPPSVP